MCFLLLIFMQERSWLRLIASIRENRPLNEAREVSESTMTGILGRESAYTGQVVTWEELLEADLDLVEGGHREIYRIL